MHWLGVTSLPLRRGIDCPETAEYFPMTKMFLSGQRPAVHLVAVKHSDGCHMSAMQDPSAPFPMFSASLKKMDRHLNGDIPISTVRSAEGNCYERYRSVGTEGPHLDAVRRSALVIRTVGTVGNYDYLYSIRFKPDASIEVCGM